MKPDVLAKGGDWKPEAIVGGTEVKGWGGTVHSIPLVAGRSTTSVISRIRGSKS
ncbi:Bifunctional protein HldE [compost metagenome]